MKNETYDAIVAEWENATDAERVAIILKVEPSLKKAPTHHSLAVVEHDSNVALLARLFIPWMLQKMSLKGI